MKIKLKVSTTEQTYEVMTDLYVVVQWERKFKRKAAELATSLGVEDLAFLAYESCKRANVPVPPSFDEYCRRLEAIEVVNEEPTNPTPAGTDEP